MSAGFFKNLLQISEMFLKESNAILVKKGEVLTGSITVAYIANSFALYLGAFKRKCTVLDNKREFYDRKVLGLARPGNYNEQNAAYNCHKCKHALKFQT